MIVLYYLLYHHYYELVFALYDNIYYNKYRSVKIPLLYKKYANMCIRKEFTNNETIICARKVRYRTSIVNQIQNRKLL